MTNRDWNELQNAATACLTAAARCSSVIAALDVRHNAVIPFPLPLCPEDRALALAWIERLDDDKPVRADLVRALLRVPRRTNTWRRAAR